MSMSPFKPPRITYRIASTGTAALAAGTSETPYSDLLAARRRRGLEELLVDVAVRPTSHSHQ